MKRAFIGVPWFSWLCSIVQPFCVGCLSVAVDVVANSQQGGLMVQVWYK